MESCLVLGVGVGWGIGTLTICRNGETESGITHFLMIYSQIPVVFFLSSGFKTSVISYALVF